MTDKFKTLMKRLWALGCSLKLAIALATAAALLIMAGSLVMHFNPHVFANIEKEILSDWLPSVLEDSPFIVLWIPLTAILVILFAINTFCCFLDWLTKLKFRWRKTGEYLIHAGFIFLTISYFWGNVSGFRSGPHRLAPGEKLTIPDMPAYSVELTDFSVVQEPSGRPLDMINEVTLWKEDRQVKQKTVKINHPLIYDGLVILASSFGQEITGFRFHNPQQGFVDLVPGSRQDLPQKQTLLAHRFYPHAQRDKNGRVQQVGARLGNPAFQLSLVGPSGMIWQGWYFLRQPLPEALRVQGIILNPMEPISSHFSLLTINRDPADKLALGGGILLTLGVILAFFSFYRKRALGDRPDL